MIIGVAIKHKDLMICLPRPNRHHDCIRYAVETLGLTPPCGGKNQGFYTAKGEYLTRELALQYVIQNNQPLRNPNAKIRLFSEDLW